MSEAHDFRNLVVWQKAKDLAKLIYQLTARMPETERFGLTSQIRRSAVSVPSNIAEGNARQTRKDYLKHLTIARGSLAELETQILIASELNMLPEAGHAMTLLGDTKRLLQALIRSLQDRQ